jgi:hypothetical protein
MANENLIEVYQEYASMILNLCKKKRNHLFVHFTKYRLTTNINFTTKNLDCPHDRVYTSMALIICHLLDLHENNEERKVTCF